MAESTVNTFEDITARLDEIITTVRSKDTSLERSLDLFDEDADSRFLFTDGAEFNDKDIDPHTRSIEDMTLFTYGWCTKKYTNLRSDGTPATLTFPDTDLPVFRAADAYLMLTEAQFRNGGILSDGLASINAVRERAGLEPYSGSVSVCSQPTSMYGTGKVILLPAVPLRSTAISILSLPQRLTPTTNWIRIRDINSQN